MANSSILHIGDKFSSLAALTDAVKLFEAEQHVTYWKRDSRTLAAAKRLCVNLQLNDAIKYFSIKFCCVKGGKKYDNANRGKRPKQK